MWKSNIILCEKKTQLWSEFVQNKLYSKTVKNEQLVQIVKMSKVTKYTSIWEILHVNLCYGVKINIFNNRDGTWSNWKIREWYTTYKLCQSLNKQQNISSLLNNLYYGLCRECANVKCLTSNWCQKLTYDEITYNIKKHITSRCNRWLYTLYKVSTMRTRHAYVFLHYFISQSISLK